MITSVFSGCAAIPGKNVKLENYPESGVIGKNLDLSFEYLNTEKLDEYHEFNDVVGNQLKKNSIQQSSEMHICSVKISTKNGIKEDGFCKPYFAVTFFTLFTIPFYCQEKYQAHATLISYPKDSETRGHNIKLSINQAKLGDFFLDENDRPAKLLKTYELKDKVHEVWSLLWMLSWFVYNPESSGTPEGAKKLTEENISEALVRSILNDASTFEECQKDQPSSGKKK